MRRSEKVGATRAFSMDKKNWADCSARTRNSAIPDVLVSVADPVELFKGMVQSDANIRMDHDRQRVEMCVSKLNDDTLRPCQHGEICAFREQRNQKYFIVVRERIQDMTWANYLAIKRSALCTMRILIKYWTYTYEYLYFLSVRIKHLHQTTWVVWQLISEGIRFGKWLKYF